MRRAAPHWRVETAYRLGKSTAVFESAYNFDVLAKRQMDERLWHSILGCGLLNGIDESFT